jgi:hypothetical protein
MFDALIRGGATVPEFLYPKLAGTRFSVENGGVPALSMMVLPHLSDSPDRVFDELAAEVLTWPYQTTAQHYLRLFAWLGRRFGGTVAVERSGFSLGWIPWLRRCFPDAHFVHLHRNGPDSALSMSRHPGYRLFLLIVDTLELLDLGVGVSALECASAFSPETVPVDLIPIIGDRYDYDYLMGLDLPVARFAELWSNFVRLGVSALSDLPADRYWTLSFEDLVHDPHAKLTELAEFVGVTPSDQWLRASAATVDPSRMGAASRLSPREFEEVRERCAPGKAALAPAAR